MKKIFENNAEITNEGSILLYTNIPGSDFLNNGNFINGVNGFVQGYNFHNSSGTISGGGNFYFTNNTKNQSAFGGSSSSFINFYDATPTSNGIFDVTNTTPKYTTKKPILPLATSNLVTCGEPTPPVIVVHPQNLKFCDPNSANATFTVSATSRYSEMTYQWRKNGKPIGGATSSTYNSSRFKLADTADIFTVEITNKTGTTVSNGASVHFVIVAQPSVPQPLIATGNTTTLSMQTSGALALQWKKNSKDLANGASINYKIPVVNLTDSGKYYAVVTYSGGTCITDTVKVNPSIILYSKIKGNLNDVSIWGVNKDGSGSTPIDFTREEHTFIVANRADIVTAGGVNIAGTLDVANGNVIISPGSTLDAGRIVRSAGTGCFSGSATSSLTVHGISDSKYDGASVIYFKQGANVLQYLTTAGHAVTLKNTLHITAGKNSGWLQVNSGTFNTSDSLTLKSDSLGTAIIAESYGIINGRAIIERYVPARRAWRLMCAPVTPINAPTIHAAWQEGAASSTDNPRPGYGTHITYGAIADGYDQNPQKTFSMYYYNNSDGKWIGIPPTNKTTVTAFPAYLFFVRGDRSYDITTTTSNTTPKPTLLRTFGNLNQGQQAAVQANKDSFTLISNPYASPIDFEKLYNNATNLKHTVRVWDPQLAGEKGVGAYVTLNWTGSGYKATPPSDMSSIIQPYQAFFVQTNTNISNGTVHINEKTKDFKTLTSPFGRSIAARETQDAMLEINLRVFNGDSTTGIADGVLYRFDDSYTNAVDNADVNKLPNLYENLSINNNNVLLTVERRQLPVANDTLHLSLTGTKNTNYQLEIIPQSLVGNMFLYDDYLKTVSPIIQGDTNHYTININTSDALSKAANRFSIVLQNSVALAVGFDWAKAYAKAKTIEVEWKVATEAGVRYYEIEKSPDAATFTKAGEVKASGAMRYSFNDATPFGGKSYYRVKSVDNSGKPTYTTMLPVAISQTSFSHLAVYPNPFSGKAFNVELTNKKAGKYTLIITNMVGQQLYTQRIAYNGGLATYPIALKNALAKGVYLIKAIAADGTSDIIKAVIQ